MELAAYLSSLTIEQLGMGAAQRESGTLSALGHARTACNVASILLEGTARSLSRLEPEMVFRLASCARVAMGPAPEAVQQAHAAAVDSLQPAPAELAHAVVESCAALLHVVARLEEVTWRLQCQDAAAALKASICQVSEIAALCHQCAPILEWCKSQLGEAL